MESGQNRAAAGVLAAMRPADEKWGLVLKGKRRKCSPFEMMFKKNIVQAKTIGQKKERGVFKLADFRKDVKNDDNSILDISAYRREFTKFDENGDGQIDVREFGRFLRGLGLIPDDREVLEVFNYIDSNNDGDIEFDEFLHVLDHPMISLSRQEIRQSMEESVRRLSDSRPSLSPSELREMLTKRGSMPMTDTEVDDLLIRLGAPQEVVDCDKMVDKLLSDQFNGNKPGPSLD